MLAYLNSFSICFSQHTKADVTICSHSLCLARGRFEDPSTLMMLMLAWSVTPWLQTVCIFRMEAARRHRGQR